MAPTQQRLPGDLGYLIQASPCCRYQIRRASMLTFPASAIINVVNKTFSPSSHDISTQLTVHSAPELASYLSSTYPSGVKTGDAVSSSSFALSNCSCIIHTTVPNHRRRYHGNLPLLRQLLSNCYRRCLEEAFKLGVETIAFPAIGVGGNFGWPRHEACKVGVQVVARWFGHPIKGKERRDRIPGPIYFLADPQAENVREELAWIEAFVNTFPDFHPPPPRHLELLSRDFDRARSMGRTRQARRGLEYNSTEPQDLSPQATVSRRRRRRVGQRELQGMSGSSPTGTEPAAGRGNPRVRRPPQRYGQ